MGKISIFSFIVAVFVSIFVWSTSYNIDKDINGWKERAQVSSEPNDMYEYMSNVKDGMDDWNMHSGHAAVIFKTPANDMSLIYHTVVQHVDQAEILTKMERSSPEYQTGLDNLRGSIRELDLHAFKFWGSTGSGLLLVIMTWLSWICFIVFGIAFGAVWLENY